MVENPILAVQSAEGAAQSAIQYFENMRNFLEAVKEMKLLTFEASDLEKVLESCISYNIHVPTFYDMKYKNLAFQYALHH